MLRGLTFLVVLSLSAAAEEELSLHPLYIWSENALGKLREMQKQKPDFLRELHIDVPNPYSFVLNKRLENRATYALMVTAILKPDAQTFKIELRTSRGILFFSATFHFNSSSIVMRSDLLPKGKRTETIMAEEESFDETDYFYTTVVMNPYHWQVYYVGRWHIGRLDPPPEASMIHKVHLSGDYRGATVALTSPYGSKEQGAWFDK